MMTMTTLMANHTPRHPTQTTNPSKPPSTREVLTAPKSNIWCNHNKSYDTLKFLHESPTKTSSHLSTNAIVNLPVIDDDQHPWPITTAPDPNFLQEWNDFSTKFNDFYTEFAKFCNEYDHLTNIRENDASTLLDFSIDNNDNWPANNHASYTPFCQVIGELEKVNSQFFQLLEHLENPVPCMHPSLEITSNPQQPAQCPTPQLMQIPQCITKRAVPPASNLKPNPAEPGALAIPISINNNSQCNKNGGIWPNLLAATASFWPQTWSMLANPSGPHLDWHWKQSPLRKIPDQIHCCAMHPC